MVMSATQACSATKADRPFGRPPTAPAGPCQCALQEKTISLESTVLHQCIRPRVGAHAPDHHGNPRASDLITGHASEGYWGHQFSDALGKTISPSLLFLSQTSVGKRSWRLHRVSPDCEHFVLIHAAWDAGFIGLISKLRPRPPCRTPHTMRAILLASAIASLKRLSRRAAASIQDLRPCFSQLCGRRLLAAFHDFAPPAPVAPRP